MIALLVAVAFAQAPVAPGSPADTVAPVVVVAPPRAEVRVLGAPAFVNGQVEVEVAIWRDVAGGAPPPPVFPELRVRDAVTVPSPSAPPPAQERDGDVEWLVQRRHYYVMPLVAGPIEVPSVVVRWDAGTGWEKAATEPLRFDAVAPPGLSDGMVWVVAPSVTVTQTVEGGMRVGEAFTRVVRIDARGIDSMLLPPLLGPVGGALGEYPKDPSSSTTANRGVVTATREERVTYVPQRLGRFTLPEVGLWWYEPASGAWTWVSAEPVTFFAAPNPSLGLEAAGTFRAAAGWFAPRLGVVGAIGVLAWALARRGLRWGVVGRGTAERQAWRAFTKAARSGAGATTLDALYRWLAVRDPDGPLTLDAAFLDHPDVRARLAAVEAGLYAGGAAGATSDLVGAVRAYARKTR